MSALEDLDYYPPDPYCQPDGLPGVSPDTQLGGGAERQLETAVVMENYRAALEAVANLNDSGASNKADRMAGQVADQTLYWNRRFSAWVAAKTGLGGCAKGRKNPSPRCDCAYCTVYLTSPRLRLTVRSGGRVDVDNGEGS